MPGASFSPKAPVTPTAPFGDMALGTREQRSRGGAARPEGAAAPHPGGKKERPSPSPSLAAPAPCQEGRPGHGHGDGDSGAAHPALRSLPSASPLRTLPAPSRPLGAAPAQLSAVPLPLPALLRPRGSPKASAQQPARLPH